jgi:hypothetical protein
VIVPTGSKPPASVAVSLTCVPTVVLLGDATVASAGVALVTSTDSPGSLHPPAVVVPDASVYTTTHRYVPAVVDVNGSVV